MCYRTVCTLCLTIFCNDINPNVLNIGKRYVVKKLKSSDKYHPEFCYWICIPLQLEGIEKIFRELLYK